MAQETGPHYLGTQCHLIATELDSLGRSLIQSAQQSAYGGNTEGADTFGYRAGTAASLRSRINHTLRAIEHVMHKCEEVAAMAPIRDPHPLERAQQIIDSPVE